MKKFLNVLKWVAISFIGLIIILSIVGLLLGKQGKNDINKKQKTQIAQKIPFHYEEFAYFRSHNKFRVFVYYVNDTNWAKIRRIGDDLMHTDWKPTVAFFYTDRNLLTQISNMSSFYDALRFGYKKGCVAEYWKQPKGDVVFKKFPKEDFN